MAGVKLTNFFDWFITFEAMKKFLTLALFFTLTLPMLGQKLMEPIDLLKFQRIGGEIVDSKGEILIYLVTTINVEADKGVRRAEMFNLKTGEQRTLIPESFNPHQLSFSPDGKKVGFLSAQSGQTQLYEISLTSQTPEQITHIEGGIHFYQYDPQGKYLALGISVKLDSTATEIYPNLPKTQGRIIDGLLYRHWNAWNDYHYNHVFLAPYKTGVNRSEAMDIMAGEKFHSPTMPFGGADEVTFSKDGSKLIYACKKLHGTASAVSTNTDLYEYDIASGSTKNLTQFNVGYDLHPSINPTGTQLAWLSMERAGYESDKNRIITLDFKTQAVKDLTANFKYSVESFAWSNDGKEIYFTSTINATAQLFVYSFKDGKIKQLTEGMHNYNSVHPIGNGAKTQLIASRVSMSSPANLYKVDLKGNANALLKWNDDLLNSLAMGKVEKRMVKTTDNQEMLSWVIYPPNFDSTKKYPTLLYCQGGPQSPVSQFFSYRWNFQLMASQGYIVVAPNRRGLQGFGSEWNDAIGHDYGGQAMQDLLSAIDDVAQLPYVDENRLGAVGASFGGYSVYWLAGNHQNRFKAFVSHCGMFNMESWYGSTEEMFFADYDNGPYWLEKNKENYLKHSPHQYVQNWNTPILVIHNELDYRVPLSEGLQAFTAAQKMGIPSRFLYFPDEGHWVLKPQNGLLWHAEFFKWLDTYLK